METHTRTRLAVGLWLAIFHAACSTQPPPPSVAQTIPLHSQSLPVEEQFDAGNLPPGWQTDGETSLTGERAHSGDHAVKITSTAGKSRNYLSYDLYQLSAPMPELFGSMMIYLEEQNSGGGDFTLVQAEGQPAPSAAAPADTTVMYRARIDGRYDHLMANYDTRNPANTWKTDCWKQPAFDPATNTPPAPEYRLPKNQWACLRWHFDARQNRLAFWLNDVALTQITVDQTGDGCVAQDDLGIWRGPGDFRWLRVGVEQYHPDAGARALFVDDITIDDKPVSCSQR